MQTAPRRIFFTSAFHQSPITAIVSCKSLPRQDLPIKSGFICSCQSRWSCSAEAPCSSENNAILPTKLNSSSGLQFLIEARLWPGVFFSGMTRHLYLSGWDCQPRGLYFPELYLVILRDSGTILIRNKDGTAHHHKVRRGEMWDLSSIKSPGDTAIFCWVIAIGSSAESYISV